MSLCFLFSSAILSENPLKWTCLSAKCQCVYFALAFLAAGHYVCSLSYSSCLVSRCLFQPFLLIILQTTYFPPRRNAQPWLISYRSPNLSKKQRVSRFFLYHVAARTALLQLGYTDCYHYFAWIQNPQYSALWKGAYEAKFLKTGTFTREDWDELLGDLRP